MKKLILISCLLPAAAMIFSARQSDFPKLTGPYLGQKPPGKTPERFAPEIFNSNRYDWHHSIIVFSADAKEAFWQAGVNSKPVKEEIYVSMQIRGSWTVPQIAPFTKSEKFNDSPFISPDGKRFFFLSQRPMSKEGERSKEENIWVMDRTADGWSEPRPLPLAINSLSKHWQISVDRKGNLYFGVWKVDPISGRTSEFNIYCSLYENGQYNKPEKLGPEINDPGLQQFSPYISPDGSYLIFSRQGLPIPKLFISFRNYKGEWTKSIALDNILQFDKEMMNATVTHDGKYMFFLSNNGKEVYWVDASFIEELRKKELREG